jgi:hypothetical protein
MPNFLQDAINMLSSVVPDYTAPPADVAPPEQAFEPPVITVRKKAKPDTIPFPKDTPAIGKITSYGYTNDSYGDTNTEKQMGAWGPITEYGVALSPDKEKEARAKGIKPLDKIEMVLEDGSTVVRQWNDRTMQDAQAIKKYGKPLTGRFDIHAGWGKDKLPQDDMRVVDFRKAQ